MSCHVQFWPRELTPKRWPWLHGVYAKFCHRMKYLRIADQWRQSNARIFSTRDERWETFVCWWQLVLKAAGEGTSCTWVCCATATVGTTSEHCVLTRWDSPRLVFSLRHLLDTPFLLGEGGFPGRDWPPWSPLGRVLMALYGATVKMLCRAVWRVCLT